MIFLVLIISISLIVIIHELGHFWVARKSGAIVEEFGIGIPPRIFSKNINGITYSINLIPFGAFVKIFGEEGNFDQKGSFYQLPLLKRALIISAGPLANIVLGFLIMLIGFSFVGFPGLISENSDNKMKLVKEIPGIFVVNVAKDSPAEKVGIRSQDIILKVNNHEIKKPEEFSFLIQQFAGEKIEILVKRNNEELKFEVTPQIWEDGKARIGVEILKMGYIKYSFWEAVKLIVGYIFSMFQAIFSLFFSLIKRFFYAPEVLHTSAGPVGIFFILKNAYALGMSYFLFIFSQISLIIGIINLFPFPALDGFRLLFLPLEKLFKNKEKIWMWEKAINAFGIIILMVLMIILTYSDVLKLIKK